MQVYDVTLSTVYHNWQNKWDVLWELNLLSTEDSREEHHMFESFYVKK